MVADFYFIGNILKKCIWLVNKRFSSNEYPKQDMPEVNEFLPNVSMYVCVCLWNEMVWTV